MDKKMSSPLSTLQWVDRGVVKPNNYNPNKVSKQNLELLAEEKSVEEIGKQLGMRPEEIFRLSDFSKEDFLRMMIKPNTGFTKAEFITKI